MKTDAARGLRIETEFGKVERVPAWSKLARQDGCIKAVSTGGWATCLDPVEQIGALQPFGTLGLASWAIT